MDRVHPGQRANFVIRLKGPRYSSQNPLDSWRVRWIRCTIEPHTCKNVLMPAHVKSVTAVCLSSTVGKKEVVAAVRLCSSLEDLRKVVRPGTAARCLTQWPTWKNGEARHSGTLLNTSTNKVKMEEKANCFTLLRRITRLKCVNSKVRSNVECCSLDKDSPKGSCHLVEPTWVTHLYRKAIRICDLECNGRAKN